MVTLFINIQQLAGVRENALLLRGKDLAELPVIEDAFLLVENDFIAEYGHMYELSVKVPHEPVNVVDVSGQAVLPAWCDSHTHLVFAKSREEEFVNKIRGASYAEIAAKGGGILNSARVLQETSEAELFRLAMLRIKEVAMMGTGAIEIKSGYGLTVEAELKMLRVIKKLKQQSGLTIKSSFLAAHTYPEHFKENHEGYLRLIIEEMLPVISAEGLADYIDVFCEEGFFSVAEMETVCKAGAAIGLVPKLHVNQLNSIGGVPAGIALGALSLDHLETMTDDDTRALAGSRSIGTLLPSAAFFLRMGYQPARHLIDAGAAIALATDYNPGSSPSGNMNFIISLACIQMKMLPEEAINAATLNGAYAMGCAHELGSITVGKKANLIFTKPIPSLAYLPYAFGNNMIAQVMINGLFIS